MENSQPFEVSQPAARALPDYPKVRLVLLALASLCLVGAVLGAFAYQEIASIAGWKISAMDTETLSIQTAADRWQLRLLLALNHLFTFLLPSATIIAIFYGQFRYAYWQGNAHEEEPRWRVADWRDYLLLRRFPHWKIAGVTILLMLSSLPLVIWLYQINKGFPMPEAFRLIEEQTEAAIKGLLVMDSPVEFLANLALIALLPAIGEELVFRGVLQRQLMRRIARPWIAILLSAAIFSAVHMQFEGFLSRWLLGVLLGWLYWRSGNFWVPVLAHFFNNGLQIVAQYLYKNELSSVDLEQDINVPWPAALVSLLLLLGVMWLFLHRTGWKKEPPSSPQVP